MLLVTQTLTPIPAHKRMCVARLVEFMRTSSHCDTISISVKYEDYRIYAEAIDMNILIYL